MIKPDSSDSLAPEAAVIIGRSASNRLSRMPTLTLVGRALAVGSRLSAGRRVRRLRSDDADGREAGAAVRRSR